MSHWEHNWGRERGEERGGEGRGGEGGEGRGGEGREGEGRGGEGRGGEGKGMVGGWGRGHTTDSFLVEDTEIFTVGAYM